MAWSWAPPGSLFYTHLKRNKVKQTIHNNLAATWCVFYTSPSSPTHPLWTAHYLIPYWSTSSSENPGTGVNTMRPLTIHTSYSTSSLWRWNWQRVPKRRQTTIWRRGDTQKNIYNIQDKAKVRNQEWKLCAQNYAGRRENSLISYSRVRLFKSIIVPSVICNYK